VPAKLAARLPHYGSDALCSNRSRLKWYSGKFPPLLVKLQPSPGASIEATVAAVSRTVLLAMIPGQQEGIEAAYQAALAKIPDSAGKEKGLRWDRRRLRKSCGRAPKRRAWKAIGRLRRRKYVPTLRPVSLTAALRKPWVLDSCDQFRPGPPPALDSEVLGSRLQ
jgi:hypothetical protein